MTNSKDDPCGETGQTNRVTRNATVQRDDLDQDPDLGNNQTGVQKAIATKAYFSRPAFSVAYAALFLTIFANRFSVYSALTYNAFATSAFSQHSLLSAAGVASDLTQLCAYPIIAKLGDVVGRAEGFLVSTVLLVVGSIMSAACPNIGTYIVAGIFNAIGDTGLLLTEQVFIAETTSLVNRGLLAAIPESVTGIVALVAGSLAAELTLQHAGWRWGYGMWAIILPACAAPLIAILFTLQCRAVKSSTALSTKTTKNRVMEPLQRISRYVLVELDLPGAILLIAGLGLILIPLSLTGSSNVERWGSPSLIPMLVVGVVVIVCFGIWDGRFAKKPIVPLSLIRRRTVVAACLLGMFDFLAYTLFTTFFPSSLQVAGGYNPGQATLLSNALIIAYQITRILTGIGLRLSKRPFLWIIGGVPMIILGQGLLIRLTNMPNGAVGGNGSLVVARVLIGVGRGMYHTAALVAVQAEVPESELSIATALYLALMTVGSAIGGSIGGAVWRSTLNKNLIDFLPDDAKSAAHAIFGSIVVAKKYNKGTITRRAIDDAYRESTSLLAAIATGCLVPMLALMLGIKNVSLKRIETDTCGRR